MTQYDNTALIEDFTQLLATNGKELAKVGIRKHKCSNKHFTPPDAKPVLCVCFSFKVYIFEKNRQVFTVNEDITNYPTIGNSFCIF